MCIIIFIAASKDFPIKQTLEYEMWFTIDRYQLPVLYFNN